MYILLVKFLPYSLKKLIFALKLFKLISLLRFRHIFERIFLHEEGAMRAS